MSCLVPLQPCHLFLPWLCGGVLQSQLAQGMRCMGPERVLLPAGAWHTPCAGLGTTVLIYGPIKQELTSPVPCSTLGVQPSEAAAMARNCKARTGPLQSSQLLIVSRHLVPTPHLHLIYSMEPEGPQGMAVAGAVVRTELLLAEAGTLGVPLKEQLAPQSWLRPGQGTVVFLWRMWLVGGSMLCQPRRQWSSDW